MLSNKILFICFNHSVDGSRLYYRQAQTLLSNKKDVEIYFLNSFDRGELDSNFRDKNRDIHIIDIEYSRIKPVDPNQKNRSIFDKIKWRLNLYKRKGFSFFEKYYRIWKIKPDVIQASHINELLFAFLSSKILNTRLIFDAHEDYYNFYYEYSGRTFSGFIKAIVYSVVEILLIRSAEAVFCTDQFLFEKYSKGSYNPKKLNLLRNFANLQFAPDITEKEFTEKNTLRLVYIGTINQYRGVIETVEYLRRFNNEFSDKSLTLDIYGRHSPILDSFTKGDGVTYHGSLGYPKLLDEINQYDVGTCLLLPIKKYERNIPVKIFDYMSAGLPLLVSNFGPCKQYTELSSAGICIDPESYSDFKEAISKLFDPEGRKYYSQKGLEYCANEASFEREAQPYVEEMLNP